MGWEGDMAIYSSLFTDLLSVSLEKVGVFFPQQVSVQRKRQASVDLKSECYQRSNIWWQQLKNQFRPYSYIR